jgi:predicted GIY-YIG superfamily endonuclease
VVLWNLFLSFFIRPNIKFMMEMEKKQSLPFLDVLVSRRPDGLLGHTVYRKPTHTDLYLHTKFAHHPAQKKGVLHSLIQHARKLCDSDSLDKEIQHLKEIFGKNGYSNHDTRQEVQKKDKPRPKQEKLTTVARLPYQGATSHKVSRLLVKNKLGLKAAGIYRIPCECGEVYVGQTEQTIETRLKEHRRHVCLNQLEKSAVAEHWITTSQSINFDGATKLEMATKYMDPLVKETIEIWLHPDNFNRDDGFNQSHT